MHYQIAAMLVACCTFGTVLTLPVLAVTSTTVVDLNYTRQQGYLGVCGMCPRRSMTSKVG